MDDTLEAEVLDSGLVTSTSEGTPWSISEDDQPKSLTEDQPKSLTEDQPKSLVKDQRRSLIGGRTKSLSDSSLATGIEQPKSLSEEQPKSLNIHLRSVGAPKSIADERPKTEEHPSNMTEEHAKSVAGKQLEAEEKLCSSPDDQSPDETLKCQQDEFTKNEQTKSFQEDEPKSLDEEPISLTDSNAACEESCVSDPELKAVHRKRALTWKGFKLRERLDKVDRKLRHTFSAPHVKETSIFYDDSAVSMEDEMPVEDAVEAVEESDGGKPERPTNLPLFDEEGKPIRPPRGVKKSSQILHRLSSRSGKKVKCTPLVDLRGAEKRGQGHQHTAPSMIGRVVRKLSK